jgi:hypothetical protein
MADDYKVRMYHNSGSKPSATPGPKDAHVRATSYSDALRQAKEQNPGYHTTSSPIKK